MAVWLGWLPGDAAEVGGRRRPRGRALTQALPVIISSFCLFFSQALPVVFQALLVAFFLQKEEA